MEGGSGLQAGQLNTHGGFEAMLLEVVQNEVCPAEITTYLPEKTDTSLASGGNADSVTFPHTASEHVE